jgi:hypothetical protein
MTVAKESFCSGLPRETAAPEKTVITDCAARGPSRNSNPTRTSDESIARAELARASTFSSLAKAMESVVPDGSAIIIHCQCTKLKLNAPQGLRPKAAESRRNARCRAR